MTLNGKELFISTLKGDNFIHTWQSLKVGGLRDPLEQIQGQLIKVAHSGFILISLVVYNKYHNKQSLKTMYSSKRVIRPNNEVVRYYCDNGYGLSVACHEHSYGGKEGLYEIALLKGDKLHYDDEWTDVRGWLTRGEVWSWLRIVSEY